MGNNKQRAAELAARPYSLIMFRDGTTDDEVIYVAFNPEFEGCVTQGQTMNEAQADLAEVRKSIIEHLLEHSLPVPEPSWIAIRNEDTSIDLSTVKQRHLQNFGILSVAEPNFENQLLEAS